MTGSGRCFGRDDRDRVCVGRATAAWAVPTDPCKCDHRHPVKWIMGVGGCWSKHHHRFEHWIVVCGVKTGAGTDGTLTGALHPPENPGKTSLDRGAGPEVLWRGRHHPHRARSSAGVEQMGIRRSRMQGIAIRRNPPHSPAFAANDLARTRLVIQAAMGMPPTAPGRSPKGFRRADGSAGSRNKKLASPPR